MNRRNEDDYAFDDWGLDETIRLRYFTWNRPLCRSRLVRINASC